jgi:hypothetical protein
VVLLNLLATVFIARSDFGTALQKTLQLLFTWAVPLVGAIIIISVLKATHPKSERRYDSGSMGKEQMPGIGPEFESAHGHHGGHEVGSADPGQGGDSGFGGH